MILWVVGRALGGRSVTFRRAVLVEAYSFAPYLVAMPLDALQALLIGPENVESYSQLSLGPARFLSQESPPFLLAVAESLDVFWLWGAFLVAVGLHVAGGLRWSRAWIIAGVLWMIGVGMLLAGELMQPR